MVEPTLFNGERIDINNIKGSAGDVKLEELDRRDDISYALLCDRDLKRLFLSELRKSNGE